MNIELRDGLLFTSIDLDSFSKGKTMLIFDALELILDGFFEFISW